MSKGLNILHITNAFVQSRLYNNLIANLDKLGIKQKVYSAVRTQKEANYSPTELKHIQICIRNILKTSDRFFYMSKMNKILGDLKRHIDLNDVKLFHAHTLYSDGVVALKLKKEYGIPYIVAIRSTDINIFEKYRPDLKKYRNEIIAEAEKVIFISPSYKDKLLYLVDDRTKALLKEKSEIIPNGITSDFFSDEHVDQRNKYNEKLKLLYVGSFIKRKNIPVLIKAAERVSKIKPVQLTIVGGGKGDDKTWELIRSNQYPFINYMGRINDPKELKKIYSKHDIFVMISRNETFGLVYIEALSQGMPIVYTKNEGVDGYFDNISVGEAIGMVDDPKEVANAILKLSERLSADLSNECIAQAEKFDWNIIASNYKNIYESIS